MKKVEVVESQKKEGSGLFVIVDILVKIILLIMLSLLNRFKIYTPPPPTPTPPLEISVDDQFTIEDITAFDFIPLNININVGDNFYIDDSISYMFIGNEISINVIDVFYLYDAPLTLLRCIPINISVTDSFAIEDNTSMQFGTNVVNVSAEDVFYLDDTPSISLQYVPINISVQDTFYLDDEPSISLQQINWLVGWNYRKAHTITGSTAGAVTDYQVRITVWNTTGTDSGENVYLGSNVNQDFGDVRFTDSDGNLLSYWIESIGSSNAVFWVKVPSIPASPDSTTIYIYYGNPSATTTSNIADTFIVGLDFTQDPGWTFETNNPDFFTKHDLDTSRYVSPPSSYVLGTRDDAYTASAGSYADIYKDYTIDSSGIEVRTWLKHYSRSLRNYWYLRVYIGNTLLINEDVNNFPGSNESNWVLKTATMTLTSGTYRIKLMEYLATGVTWNPGVSFWDNFIIRKYINPEPSHGSWGSEESR